MAKSRNNSAGPLIQIQRFEKFRTVQNYKSSDQLHPECSMHRNQNVTILVQYSAKAGSLAICLICAAWFWGASIFLKTHVGIFCIPNGQILLSSHYQPHIPFISMISRGWLHQNKTHVSTAFLCLPLFSWMPLQDDALENKWYPELMLINVPRMTLSPILNQLPIYTIPQNA